MMPQLTWSGGAAGGGGPGLWGGSEGPAGSEPPAVTTGLPPWRAPALLRVLDRARLADHRDLDLARVGQVVLDLLDDVPREAGRGEVVDLLGTDQDPDLAAGLDRERALDAGEALGDALQVLEPLDVRLHRLAPRTRARRADRIGDLDDGRLD